MTTTKEKGSNKEIIMKHINALDTIEELANEMLFPPLKNPGVLPDEKGYGETVEVDVTRNAEAILAAVQVIRDAVFENLKNDLDYASTKHWLCELTNDEIEPLYNAAKVLNEIAGGE